MEWWRVRGDGRGDWREGEERGWQEERGGKGEWGSRRVEKIEKGRK